MTEDLIAIANDEQLGAALRDDVAPCSDHYWTAIDGLLAFDAARTAGDATSARSRAGSRGKAMRYVPILVAVATAVIIGWLAAFQNDTGERVDTGFAAEGAAAVIGAASVEVELIDSGVDVDSVVEAIYAERPPGLPRSGLLLEGSGTLWRANAPHVDLAVELVSYAMDPESSSGEKLVCFEVIAWGGGCELAEFANTRIYPNTGGQIETIALMRAPQGAERLSIETTDGFRVEANVIQGTSWAAWDTTHGTLASAALFDADGNVIWSDTN